MLHTFRRGRRKSKRLGLVAKSSAAATACGVEVRYPNVHVRPHLSMWKHWRFVKEDLHEQHDSLFLVPLVRLRDGEANDCFQAVRGIL